MGWYSWNPDPLIFVQLFIFLFLFPVFHRSDEDVVSHLADFPEKLLYRSDEQLILSFFSLY